MGNKSLINVALGSVRDSMTKDGISCIVLQLDPTAEGDTPGLKISSLAGPVGILSGRDLTTVQMLMAETPARIWAIVRKLMADDIPVPEDWGTFFATHIELSEEAKEVADV